MRKCKMKKRRFGFLSFRAALFIFVACFVLLLTTGCGFEVSEDISRYADYMAFPDQDTTPKWPKYGMDESIWPKEITAAMDVKDYRMVCYECLDAEYSGYLVVDYSDADYAAEAERLKSYPSTDYIGHYNVREETTYDLLAVYADDYGFVYALTDGENRIIYAEQIFANNFIDDKTLESFPEEYLLDGFDAGIDSRC